MNDVYRARSPRAAAGAGHRLVELMQPALLVEITFIAVRDAGRRVVGPAGPCRSARRLAGGCLFVAGMLGNSAGGRRHRDADAEMIARIGQTLEQAGTPGATCARRCFT